MLKITGYNNETNTVTVTGWLRAYSGTNKAAYRMGGGNQTYIRIDDNGPDADTYKEARIIQYETMSGVDTGNASQRHDLHSQVRYGRRHRAGLVLGGR
ncbi:MAG: hypothetical protein L0Z50_06660 [Verrucomicrobiales bacterium]|nr:hypothetical protein [Verrucomicrobiales bacterium]